MRRLREKALSSCGTAFFLSLSVALGGCDEEGWLQVRAGEFHKCGLYSDGRVDCWGEQIGEYDLFPPEDIRFQSISTGEYHACGITTDSALECWGINDAGQSSGDPDRKYLDVSTARKHSCAVHEDGELVCWGSSDDGDAWLTDPPGGTFVEVEAGWEHVCASDKDGNLTCWGPGWSCQPEGRFISFDCSQRASTTYGIDETGAIRCWTEKCDAGEFEECTYEPDVPFTQVAVGWGHYCAITRSGAAECWASDFPDAPDEAFSQIDAGRDFTIGVTKEGTLACWGDYLCHTPRFPGD